MSSGDFRMESDSMGEVSVPADALYGAQTQRAVDNFPVSDLRMPRGMIRALGLIKAALARTNCELGLLDKDMAEAIVSAASEIASGRHDDQFPVDVFQTGSGTSSNMNCNEVIARLAGEFLARPVHANDHVNLGQSSNDVIPTAIHVSGSLLLHERLVPSLQYLATTLAEKAQGLDDVIKTGRTHLMDAMPLTMGQELRAWETQIRLGIARLEEAGLRLKRLPQGGTAVGTGINAHPELAAVFNRYLKEMTGINFQPKEDFFEGLSA